MTMDNSNLVKKTPTVSPGNYSPVTINIRDSVGAILLGILSVILMIGWMRAEARNRGLITEQKMQQENDQFDS